MAANSSSKNATYIPAVLQALLVTFLWSTSWVFIKIGLEDIPPLIFAGLRYLLGFFCLLPICLRTHGVRTLQTLPPATWRHLGILGVVYYALNHGAQFVSLDLLPAVTVNLVLGFTPVVVALLGMVTLAERPLPWQWVGIGVSVVGVLLYFYPVHLQANQALGLMVATIGMLTNAGSALLGRSINRTKTLSPLLITTISMGIGAVLLFAAGVWTSGLPVLTARGWFIVVWLAVVNTAFTFTLWNHALRTLSAMESSVLNSTMSIQIPILAVLFLGERLSGREWVGLVVAVSGIFMVQLVRIGFSRRA